MKIWTWCKSKVQGRYLLTPYKQENEIDKKKTSPEREREFASPRERTFVIIIKYEWEIKRDGIRRNLLREMRRMNYMGCDWSKESAALTLLRHALPHFLCCIVIHNRNARCNWRSLREKVGRDRKCKRVNLSKWSILNDFSLGMGERKRHLSLHNSRGGLLSLTSGRIWASYCARLIFIH